MNIIHQLEEEADAQIERSIFSLKNPIFLADFESSKIERVIDELVKIKNRGRTNSKGEPDPQGFREKAVIISQWTSMLGVSVCIYARGECVYIC